MKQFCYIVRLKIDDYSIYEKRGIICVSWPALLRTGFAYVGELKNKQIWLIYLLIQSQRLVYVYIRTV